MAITSTPVARSSSSVCTTSCCASACGADVSYRSPATSTASTCCSRAMRTISRITSRCSGSRLCCFEVLPTCQSDVCRNFTSQPSPPSPRPWLSERRLVVQRRRKLAEALRRRRRSPGHWWRRASGLGAAGRPRRERELHGERNRDLRLGDEHRARFRQGGPDPLAGRQEPVLRATGFGRVEPPNDLDRAVRHDAPFHLAGGLLLSLIHISEPTRLGMIS